MTKLEEDKKMKLWQWRNKEYDILINKYQAMAEELEEMNGLFSSLSGSASLKWQIAEVYLNNALEAEEELRRFKIK